MAVGHRLSVRDMAYISAAVALIAVCAWISVPAPVPFTLQTFAIFLCSAVLGARRGLIAVLLYVLLGALGLPVFAGMQGGFGVLVIVDADTAAFLAQSQGDGPANSTGRAGDKGNGFHAYHSFPTLPEFPAKQSFFTEYKKSIDKSSKTVYLIFVPLWTISSAG